MTNRLHQLNNKEQQLLSELVDIIDGSRVNSFILNNQRAEYGKQIVVTLSRQLQEKYGRNFEEKNFRINQLPHFQIIKFSN